MMRNWFLAIQLATLAVCHPVLAQEVDASAKMKLQETSAAVGTAIKAHDIPALEQLWSPKLIVNGPNNAVLTRAEVFSAIREGKLDYEGEYRSRIEKVEFFDSVAVVMADELVQPNFGPDSGKTIHRRSTTIWQYASSKWIMIARQATIYNPADKHY